VAKFTVDTHLFRELGELLVGRDSTALVELIKNAYDADAAKLIVHGEDLDKRKGFIRLTDDGIGMSLEEFTTGFLRIASRHKEQGNRRSLRLHRRYTGAKGIGRLAAHKLAEEIEVESFPDPDARTRKKNDPALQGVRGIIDWSAIEKKQTFDEIDEDGVVVEPLDLGRRTKFGTTLTLTKLRRKWNPKDLGRFFAEVQAFEPPTALAEKIPASALSPKQVEDELLFDTLRIRDTDSSDPGFKVVMSGDLASGDNYWQTLAAACDWIVEIDVGPKTVKYAIAPTLKARKEKPSAEPDKFTEPHPLPDTKLQFQARIFVRVGRLKLPVAEGEWARASAGIRVYFEGFRVLPYGELRNDWLGLDAAYVRRSAKKEEEDSDDGVADDGVTASRKALWWLNNSNYFGAVFLTAEKSEGLEQLVNREGFVPNQAYDAIVAIVRQGLDLANRVRKAADVPRTPRGSSGSAPTKPSRPTAQDTLGKVSRAAALLNSARASATTDTPKETLRKTTEALEAINDLRENFDEISDERAMLRVLASVGTQLAAFIHELNALVEMARLMDKLVGGIRDDKTTPPPQRKELAKVQASLTELRQSLERHAAYLTDVVTPDARRRRSRQSIAKGFDSGLRLVEHIAEQRNISIRNEIPEQLRTVPMFAAELTTVFSNLLTNAIKAVGSDGQIIAKGRMGSDGQAIVRVENSGVRVDLRKAERWFDAFQSTTAKVDPGLGQGMGLGLTITRRILEENGAEIEFVEPSKGYSTALQLIFPGD
jgi:signal transduction histidine kinase